MHGTCHPLCRSVLSLATIAVAGLFAAAPTLLMASTPAGGRAEGATPGAYRCETAGRVTYSATPCADGIGTPVAPLADTPAQRARSREAKAELRAEQRELERQRAARERAEREAQRDRLAALRASSAPKAGSAVAGGGEKKSKKRKGAKAAQSEATDVGVPATKAKKAKKRTPSKGESGKRSFDPVTTPPRRKAT